MIPIIWTRSRAWVLANVYTSQVARAASRFGWTAPTPLYPRSRAENAELLAMQAAAHLQARGFLPYARGVRRLTLEEWGETFWNRRAGPLRKDEQACDVFFVTYAMLTREAA